MRDRQHLAVDAGREERTVLRAHRTPRDLVRGCGRWVVKRRALVLSAAASAPGMPRCQTVCCGNGISIPLKVECGLMHRHSSGFRNCSDGWSVGHEPDRDAVRGEALDAPDLGLLDGGLQVSGDSPRDGTTQGVATLTSSLGYEQRRCGTLCDTLVRLRERSDRPPDARPGRGGGARAASHETPAHRPRQQ